MGAARDARTVDELRAEVDIDFGLFNVTLERLAPRYSPISHADAHDEAMRQFVDRNRTDLVARLRSAMLKRFDAREPIEGWAELRSLRWLSAPESWGLTKDSADSVALQAYVEQALTDRVGALVAKKGDGLPAYEQVRSRNIALVRSIASDLVALVRAAGRPLPAILADPEPAEAITTRFDQVGVFDFRDLTENDVVAWLAALRQWPSGMPQTTELGVHGLSQDVLTRTQAAAARARAERLRLRRIITIGDREFDVETGDYGQLLTELQQSFDDSPGIKASRNRFARLEPPAAVRKASASASGRPRAAITPDSMLSPAQREAIGFVGEWFAYHWLRRYHPAADEFSWVSTNRRRVFPGDVGDDSLGFDFRVGSGKQPLMFEVKASRSEGGRIELGETEVRAAQRFAGSERWRILVITSVFDASRLTVTMLPNPFSAGGRGLYREEGGALRFSYRLEN